MIKVMFRQIGYSVADIRDNRVTLVDLNSNDVIDLTIDQFMNECDSIDSWRDIYFPKSLESI